MKNKEEHSDFQLNLDDGGSLARRKTELLPDGSYLFEDELEVASVLTAVVITCAAWLLELYELESGELSFISAKEHIRPNTKRFGVLYPPFSITQFCFKNVKAGLIGFAARESLPADFTTGSSIFEATLSDRPTSVAQEITILETGTNRQRTDMNPTPSLLSLKAKRLIDENYLAYPSIGRIAARLGVTHEHLSRQFKRDFDMTPSNYFRQLRVADASVRLAGGEEIINVAQDVGYNDLSRFYKQFRETTNTSPGVCKKMLRRSRI